MILLVQKIFDVLHGILVEIKDSTLPSQQYLLTVEIKPLLIFRESKYIKIAKKHCWYNRVIVISQQKTCFDKKVIIEWISKKWGNVLINLKN